MTLTYDLPRIGRYRLYDRAGRKVWDPIYMCGPAPGYPDCEIHECDAFSCLCPFPHVLPVAAPLPPSPGRP